MQTSETSKNVEAYQAIKQLIANRKLFPGQKLIYRDLEEMLGMSKTPIINSLMRLEQEGMVVSKRNRGFFMREVSAEEAEQIYDLREKLEVISVEYAIEKHTSADLRILEKPVTQYNDLQSSVYDSKRLQLDTEIHMAIARMGRNDFFASMLRTFYENIYFMLNVIHLASQIDQFKQDHVLLFEAIREGDREKAVQVIRAHIRAARKALTGALGG